MAHELTIRENGKVEMAYVGDTPWHGLGNVLTPGAAIEEWIYAAGMDWRIQRGRVRYAVSRDSDATDYREFDDRVVLFRGDSKAPLGIVSDGFQIVQPRETIEFFRDLVGNAGGQLETAGTLFRGRKFWAMARFGADTVVADRRGHMKLNLLLATACDGSMATEGSWISTRVVCNNTLQIGRSETGSDAIRVKINHRTKFDATTVKAELGIEKAQSVFARTVSDMRKLAELKLSPRNVVLATAKLFNPDFRTLDDKAQNKGLNSKPVQTVGKLALDGTAIGAEHDGMAGTAYGWLNAVTEYVDHTGRARTADARLDSAWFGKGADMKERAFAMAMAGAEDDARAPGSAVDSVNAWLASHS